MNQYGGLDPTESLQLERFKVASEGMSQAVLNPLVEGLVGPSCPQSRAVAELIKAMPAKVRKLLV